MTSWSEDELALLDAAEELEIAVRRADGTLRRWTPVWVVRAGNDVYVRTWWRRETGWYGAALRSRAARVRVPGLEAEVVVEDVGAGADSMVTPEAVASTLRLRLAPAGAVGAVGGRA